MCPEDHYTQSLERPVTPDPDSPNFEEEWQAREKYEEEMKEFPEKGECCLSECEEHPELSSFQKEFALPQFMSNGGDEDYLVFCACPDPSVHSLYRYYGNVCGHKNIFQIGNIRLMEFCHS
jgi:hypothetical protein